jgi:hypothetical protein
MMSFRRKCAEGSGSYKGTVEPSPEIFMMVRTIKFNRRWIRYVWV